MVSSYRNTVATPPPRPPREPASFPAMVVSTMDTLPSYPYTNATPPPMPPTLLSPAVLPVMTELWMVISPAGCR